MEESVKKAWDQWVLERPKQIQTMCQQYPPDKLYQMKSTGRYVLLHSYNEDNTVDVLVLRNYNPDILFERHVCGINPNDLQEINSPLED